MAKTLHFDFSEAREVTAKGAETVTCPEHLVPTPPLKQNAPGRFEGRWQPHAEKWRDYQGEYE